MRQNLRKQKRKLRVIVKRRGRRLKNCKGAFLFKTGLERAGMSLHLVTKKKKSGTMSLNKRKLFRSSEKKRKEKKRKIRKTNDLMNYAFTSLI